ncbi:MAG: SRPBCC domain-containing protein [Candidatus Eremiobacteraeota bacterium]|nr:SRPBCC domain-containing protein [Candidatus Eremiobacteraeota bacterium]
MHVVSFVFTLVVALASFDRGPVHVVTTDDPKRIDWSLTVPASLDAVWDAFTTSEGLSAWAAPAANVELRDGGKWLVNFPNAAPGGGTILIYQPKTLLAISAMAPERFPNVRRERTLAVFTFTPSGPDRTEVHLTQTGWKTGDEWDRAFAYLSEGNAQLLQLLYRRFASGPIDWSKLR